MRAARRPVLVAADLLFPLFFFARTKQYGAGFYEIAALSVCVQRVGCFGSYALAIASLFLRPHEALWCGIL